MERRTTWLWSTPRSGAALLLELLAYPLRPDMQTALGFRPPPARATVAPHVIPVDELGFAGHVAPWPGETIEVHGDWVPGTFLTLNEGRPTYLLSRSSADSWRPALRNLVLERLAAADERATTHVRDLNGESPIVIKEAFTTHGADRVIELLPGSRTIALVRDPRDVAASFLRDPDEFSEGEGSRVAADDHAIRLDRVTHAARVWAMSVDVCSKALDAHDETLSMRVRIEDLLGDPVEVLGRLLGWMNVERTVEQVSEAVERSSIGAIPPTRWTPPEPDLMVEVGAWADLLSDEEAAVVTGIAGRRLAELGYDAG